MDSSFISNRGRDDSNTPNNLARVGGILKSSGAGIASKGKELVQLIDEDIHKIYNDYIEQKAKQDEIEKKEYMEFMKKNQETGD